MADPALSVDGLGVTRSGRRIVDAVSFQVAPASITALLGPNGAGKSTVLKAVAALLPHDGQVRLSGQDASTLSRSDRAQRLAYVPQHSALDAPIPVREVVAQGRFSHQDGLRRPRPEDDRAIDEAMALTDVTPLATRPFSRLSYGERRRVLLARALCTGARLLLLDEPTAALDVGHTLALLRTLRALADAGAAVLLVLHQLQEAVDVADHAVLLDGGRMAAVGPVRQVVSADPVRRVYGVDLLPDAHFGFRLPPGGP